ncbi:MAG TPA: hypothetical protein VFX12_13360 [Vicinamibacterales bacterium]|nr:hypothetical protein [Vicinamibacterales bacterium]
MTLTRRMFVEKRRMVLPIVVGAIAAALLYGLVVYPLGRTVSANEAAGRGMRAALRSARQDQLAARALVTGKSTAQDELQQFYSSVLPANEAEAVRLTYLRVTEIARDSNVRHERIVNDVTRKKGSPLAKLTSTFVLSGDYEDVRRFVYALETAPEFLVLENVALSNAEQQRQGGLAVTLQVATYFRAGDGN